MGGSCWGCGEFRRGFFRAPAPNATIAGWATVEKGAGRAEKFQWSDPAWRHAVEMESGGPVFRRVGNPLRNAVNCILQRVGRQMAIPLGNLRRAVVQKGLDLE